MEDKPTRGNGPLTALIIVFALLVLLTGVQYSLTHDLPVAQYIRAALSRNPEKAPAAVPAETPVPASDEAEDAAAAASAAPVTPVSYDAYLLDTLLPQYGQASQDAVESAVAAGYTFADGAAPNGAVGLCSAAAIDLTGDGMDELVVLLIRQDGADFPLEMRIYGMRDGAIGEYTESAATVMQLCGAPAAQNDCIEIVSHENEHYLLFHRYMEDGATFSDRYIAYEITDAKSEPALDGALSYYGGTILVAGVMPPWLAADTFAAAPSATDKASGLSGVVLYADAVTDAPYGNETVSFSAYQDAYASAFAALDGMLGPLDSVERIPLLDPIGQDWTGLARRLAGPDSSGEDEAYDGYAPPDDYVELETPEDPAND